MRVRRRRRFNRRLLGELGLVDHCKRTVAAAAAGVAVSALAVGKWNTTCNTFVLLSLLPVSHFSLFLPEAFSVSRVSRAALVAARHTLRRPRAVCK